jgi:hypothetical protein
MDHIARNVWLTAADQMLNMMDLELSSLMSILCARLPLVGHELFDFSQKTDN